ncbi:hypothetical protein PPACK8108_LOCUS20295 [Phakopsora pachyrhizi]|uniref:Uncharacterized protein n=1 Tax=Phakopsora pachyrhizi TaxID=170000 RepID=A0AAV0BFL2_PHAPC|nr:hypothetical protein PPACK8108_LOCUS20295 [Phakopsora pachyrhizi]
MKEASNVQDQSSKGSKVELIRIMEHHKLKLLFLSASVLTGVLLMKTCYGYQKFYRWITNSEDVTSDMLRRLGEKRIPIRFKGFATSVGMRINLGYITLLVLDGTGYKRFQKRD